MLGRHLAGTLSPVCVTVACSISRSPQAQAGEGLDRVPRVRPLPWDCGRPRGEDRAPSTQVSFLAAGCPLKRSSGCPLPPPRYFPEPRRWEEARRVPF